MQRLFALLALVGGVSAGVGFCNDKDVSCAAWVRDGECDGDNAAHVKDQCPHSCGVCAKAPLERCARAPSRPAIGRTPPSRGRPPTARAAAVKPQVCSLVCGDRHDSCGAWALSGECKSAPDFMHKECPTSCGYCAPKCADLTPDCNSWAKEGNCQSNPGYMNMHCPVTCGVCHGACKDTHDDCPGWAKEGECLSNPGHTLKTCPFSCNISPCKGPVCADKNATACAVWALNEECSKNPTHMMAECPKTCGACMDICQDKNTDCANWAADGQCESNPDAMNTQCPQACGICGQLEAFYRVANGAPPKDEL